MYKCTNVRAGDIFLVPVDDRFPKITETVRAQRTVRAWGSIVPERFPVRTSTHRRRYIQSECSCDDGELGLTGSWSELSKLVCENDSGHCVSFFSVPC